MNFYYRFLKIIRNYKYSFFSFKLYIHSKIESICNL